MKKPNDQNSRREARWLQKVDQYILQRLEDHHLVIGDIADAVCLSERQFFRKFERITGETPNHHIQLLRLRKARELLESGRCETVKEVALCVGFHNPDYFSQLYETHHGKRPSQFFQISQDSASE